MDTISIRPPFTEVSEDTREGRALALYLDRGSEFVRVSHDTFLVPSRSKRGVEYLVDLAAETCECYDHKRNGGPCLHAYAAMLHQAWLRRVTRRTGECAGCGQRFPRGELVEVQESLTYHAGDLLCSECWQGSDAEVL